LCRDKGFYRLFTQIRVAVLAVSKFADSFMRLVNIVSDSRLGIADNARDQLVPQDRLSNVQLQRRQFVYALFDRVIARVCCGSGPDAAVEECTCLAAPKS
jgi:hypothetical protein